MKIDRKILLGGLLATLLLLNTCTNCSTSRKTSKLIKQTESLSNQVDSLSLQLVELDSLNRQRSIRMLAIEDSLDKTGSKTIVSEKSIDLP